MQNVNCACIICKDMASKDCPEKGLCAHQSCSGCIAFIGFNKVLPDCFKK